MRAFLLALLAGCAVAEIPPIELANVSHVLYLNNCYPYGCTVLPGEDDSRSDRSSMLRYPVHLETATDNPAVWSYVVGCVQHLYEPFDLDVTTQDPGDTPHFEVMFGGHPSVMDLGSAGGVAPAVCPNHVRDNTIAFVFSAYVTNPDVLCWTAAQESGHMFGLDHAIEPADPMTWIAPPIIKPAFQDVDAPCGEDKWHPRACGCARPTQNSYQVLLDTFGPRQRGVTAVEH